MGLETQKNPKIKNKVKIDPEKFDRWIRSRFPYLRLRGQEYCVDSIFKPDRKKKLWINPAKNTYHCWKTDRSGNIIDLICRVDLCSREVAINKIKGREGDVRGFQSSIDSLKERVEKVIEKKVLIKTFFPQGYQTFSRGVGPIRDRCYAYIKNRGINPERFGVGYCESDPYKGGLVLPVYDPSGNLVYWTVRMLDGLQRYKNPPKDLFPMGRGSVIWFGEKWPPEGSVVIITEGIMDAMSLASVGFPSGALLGKMASREQALLLKKRGYRIILGFDNDSPGMEAEALHYDFFTREGLKVIGAVTPEGYKDWNQVLVEKGPPFLKRYIPLHLRGSDLEDRVKRLLSVV